MINDRHKDIKEAYECLNSLSRNKSLYKGHVDDILKMKRYYYHNLNGLKKQMNKERDDSGKYQ